MTERNSTAITPAEFLRKLAEPCRDKKRLWIASFPHADKPRWQGEKIRPDREHEFSSELNHYVSTAVFPVNANGRTIKNMLGCVAIVIDDPTTKGDAAELFAKLGEPTCRIETSDGNFQWWYFFDELATNDEVSPVLTKIVSLGLGDKSGNNAVRYARISCGVNNKREHSKPFRVHMVEWTGRRFAIEDIAEALGVGGVDDREDDDSEDDESSAVVKRLSNEDLEALVTSAESFHGPMTALAARYAAQVPPKQVVRKLRALMQESGGRDDPKRRKSWQVSYDNIPRLVASAVRKFPQNAVKALLRRGDNNKVIQDEENFRLIYENDPTLQGLVLYDEFAMRRVLTRPIPGDSDIVADSDYPRQWRDEDTIAMQQYMQRSYAPTVARDKVDGALSAWARSRWATHPVRDYLEGLKWDGKARLSDWLKTYLQAKGAPDDYLRAVGAAWMISAVARIMDPGCQADYALVLEGRQGRKKSSALRALAGDEFFSDSLPADLSSKDAADHIRGKWIIELPELAQFRKSEIETVKSFVTRRTERFRPAYGRNEIEYPRQCVFAGTTNESQYLVDDTGNRRFWPVMCTGVNLIRLRRDRDQLWAEAVRCYDDGERWHIDPKIEALAAKQTERRRLDDPWLAELRQIVATGTLSDEGELRPGQALQALGVPTEKMTAFNAARVGKLLQRLGWRKKASNAKFYVRPESAK